MEKRTVGAKLFHVAKWTDMMKLTVTFHNFVNGTNKLLWHKFVPDPSEDMVAYVQHKEKKWA